MRLLLTFIVFMVVIDSYAEDMTYLENVEKDETMMSHHEDCLDEPKTVVEICDKVEQLEDLRIEDMESFHTFLDFLDYYDSIFAED